MQQFDELVGLLQNSVVRVRLGAVQALMGVCSHADYVTYMMQNQAQANTDKKNYVIDTLCTMSTKDSVAAIQQLATTTLITLCSTILNDTNLQQQHASTFFTSVVDNNKSVKQLLKHFRFLVKQKKTNASDLKQQVQHLQLILIFLSNITQHDTAITQLSIDEQRDEYVELLCDLLRGNAAQVPNVQQYAPFAKWIANVFTNCTPNEGIRSVIFSPANIEHVWTAHVMTKFDTFELTLQLSLIHAMRYDFFIL